jgi:predicted DNA binding CopG/RHH family protein
MAAAWPGASRLGNAENTFSKDRRIHTRLSDRDMVGIQKVAAAEAVP